LGEIYREQRDFSYLTLYWNKEENFQSHWNNDAELIIENWCKNFHFFFLTLSTNKWQSLYHHHHLIPHISLSILEEEKEEKTFLLVMEEVNYTSDSASYRNIFFFAWEIKQNLLLFLPLMKAQGHGNLSKSPLSSRAYLVIFYVV
jgi:hypothetical protein